MKLNRDFWKKNMHLKKHEMAGREEVKDKSGSKFLQANVILEIWALTVIDSIEYYHSRTASPSSF